MKKLWRAAVALLFSLPCLIASGVAQDNTPTAASNKIYAQAIVDEFAAAHPEVAVLAFHVTRPGETVNHIVAANIPRIGKVSDEDDLAVINTGKLKEEDHKDKGKYEVLMPLKDRSGKIIGAVGVVFHYKDGDNPQSFRSAAEAIRDAIAQKIANTSELFKPVA